VKFGNHLHYFAMSFQPVPTTPDRFSYFQTFLYFRDPESPALAILSCRSHISMYKKWMRGTAVVAAIMLIFTVILGYQAFSNSDNLAMDPRLGGGVVLLVGTLAVGFCMKSCLWDSLRDVQRTIVAIEFYQSNSDFRDRLMTRHVSRIDVGAILAEYENFQAPRLISQTPV
jgi:hypothetical protein